MVKMVHVASPAEGTSMQEHVPCPPLAPTIIQKACEQFALSPQSGTCSKSEGLTSIGPSSVQDISLYHGIEVTLHAFRVAGCCCLLLPASNACKEGYRPVTMLHGGREN